MKFRVLGSLSTISETVTKPVEGARQRTLLALLLISPKNVVTKDQFFEELWRDKLPGAPDNALQAIVARVRKVLASEFGEDFTRINLVTHPHGYSLDVEPDQVDAHVFSSLTAEAEARAHLHPEAARDLLDRALGLWQGSALQGVSGGLICESAATQLEEMRLSAIEARIRLSIEISGHASVISELKRMTSLYPWREQLSELLMISLYRTGRQAEAIEAYNHLRRRLVDGFGLEPSQNLTKCMMAVLRQDPGLGEPTRNTVHKKAVTALAR